MEKKQIRDFDLADELRETIDRAENREPELVYEVVEHEGGWAYRVGDTLSEAFPSQKIAEQAAKRAADEQRLTGDTTDILFEDGQGVWRQETSLGDDRPKTAIKP